MRCDSASSDSRSTGSPTVWTGRSMRLSERERAMGRCCIGRHGCARRDRRALGRQPSDRQVVQYKQGSRPDRPAAIPRPVPDAAVDRAVLRQFPKIGLRRRCAGRLQSASTTNGGRHCRSRGLRPSSGNRSRRDRHGPDPADAPLAPPRRHACGASPAWRWPRAAAAAGARRTCPRIGPVPVDFILFGADAARRRAVPPPHAAGRADRARRDHRSTSSPSPASRTGPGIAGLAAPPRSTSG